MAGLSGYGIAVDVPAGWDARIYGCGDGASCRAALHAATFPLPEKRGDFGSGAVEIMGRGDVLVVLLEYDRTRTEPPLFASQGVPAAIDPGTFSPSALQRALPNQAGAQAFFTAEGRAFCLYAVLGNSRDREGLAALANQVIGAIRVEVV